MFKFYEREENCSRGVPQYNKPSAAEQTVRGKRDANNRNPRAECKLKWKAACVREFERVGQDDKPKTLEACRLALFKASRGKVWLFRYAQLGEYVATIAKGKVKGGSRAAGGGRQLTEANSDLDKKLVEWYQLNVKKGLVMNGALWTQLVELASPSIPTREWFVRWKARHNLTNKRVWRMTNRSPDELKQRIQSFHSFVKSRWDVNDYDLVLNVDEVPYALAGTTSGVSAVVPVGNTDAGKFDSNSLKRFGTLVGVLGVKKMEDGSYAKVHPKPCIIIKSTVKKPVANPQRAYLVLNECGAINEGFMLDTFVPWLTSIIESFKAKKTMLVFDSATAHITPSVKAALAKAGITLSVIPGGCTMYLQAIDQCYAAEAKAAGLTNYYATFANADDQTAHSQRDFFVSNCIHGHDAATEKIDVEKLFRRLGYLAPVDPTITRLLGYKFDPNIGQGPIQRQKLLSSQNLSNQNAKSHFGQSSNCHSTLSTTLMIHAKFASLQRLSHSTRNIGTNRAGSKSATAI